MCVARSFKEAILMRLLKCAQILQFVSPACLGAAAWQDINMQCQEMAQHSYIDK